MPPAPDGLQPQPARGLRLAGEACGQKVAAGKWVCCAVPPVWMRRRVETSGLCSDFQKGLETRWGWVSWELC